MKHSLSLLLLIGAKWREKTKLSPGVGVLTCHLLEEMLKGKGRAEKEREEGSRHAQ